MKKFLFLLLISLSLHGYPQSAVDSSGKDSISPYKIEKSNYNFDGIMRMQEERRAKEKRAAILRIGFGVAMLVLLVIGLNRRGKKKG